MIDIFEVSMEELKKVFMDFYNLTKFKIVLYSSDRQVLYSYPEKMCSFCAKVRTNETLAKKCIDCDNIGFDICDETRKPYIYECHMSAIEAISPIYFNEIHVGYLMFGQILSTEHNNFKEKVRKIGKEYNLHFTHSMISEMVVADFSYINSAVNMMSMCASYLYTNEIIRNNPNILAYQIKEYIVSHLDADLSLESLCKHFYISQSKLYKISKDHFKMGITDYVRKQRIKMAKKLILNTEDSIAQIALSVGIKDTNYFIRIFKQTEGITPLQYRKIRNES